MDTITVVRTGRSIRFVCRRDVGPFLLVAEGGTIREARDRVTQMFLSSEREHAPLVCPKRDRRR